MPPVIIFILSTSALILGVVLTRWIHSYHDLDILIEPEMRPAKPSPMVSVIVPARNEARNIERCIRSLLNQTYQSYELIVVDDRSTDETPKILERLADETAGSQIPLKIIRGVDPPTGWAGKPHALVQGVEASGGNWYCFIDADTFGTPELLASTMATALESSADLFTMLTNQELGSFWEKVVLPLVFTALSFGFPAQRVNDPMKPDAIANGQFILIKAQVYNACGGHEAVRYRIDEDKALAETVKRAGFRLIVADGRSVARTRMYTSLGEMWEGWTKNIFLGLQDRPWLLLLGATSGLLGALLLPFWLGGGLLWFLNSGSATSAIVALQALTLWAYLLSWRIRACKAYRISPLYAFTLPLGSLVFTAMMAASTYKVLTGRGVTWKGRTYITEEITS